MKMYLAYGGQVREIEVDRATEKSVWLQEMVWGKMKSNRHPRLSNYEGYYETWGGAYAHILGAAIGLENRAKHQLESAKIGLKRATENLERIQAMKEPDPCTP